ncbi:MAG: hypothetical protein BM556_00720 [Bacteriovorax sp. MedPE-SWde]|nr:MAG: hypothetical protein BM556_00720 [Bacteriovorax sp. MedPE-SWde]
MEKKPIQRFTRPGESNYQPKGKTVYVGNLRYKVTKKDLHGIFSKFGKVRDVNLITEPGSEKSKGIAFVKMLKAKEADKAIAYLDGRVVDGRTLKASEAAETNYTTTKRFAGSQSGPKKDICSAKELDKLKKASRLKREQRGLGELKAYLAKK